MMPRLGGDLVGALKAAADGDLGDVRLEWRRESCVAVVVASAGYPGRYATGHPIRGLAAAEELEGVAVFQAGTRLDGDSTVTHGGRVLAVSALGPDLEGAAQSAYEGVEMIGFEGMHFRRDIGRVAGPARAGA